MFLGLDIGRQFVKMVAADQTKDGYKLVDAGSRLVPEPNSAYDPEKIDQAHWVMAVKELFRQQNFNPKKVMETLPTSEHTAYSENKGEKLAFCLNSSKEGTELIDENTLMFVALHELSHIGTSEVGHTPIYWKNFKFILENAVDAGVYTAVNYKQKPTGYCGMTITDNPYYDL